MVGGSQHELEVVHYHMLDIIHIHCMSHCLHERERERETLAVSERGGRVITSRTEDMSAAP